MEYLFQVCWGRISICEEGMGISGLWEEYTVEKGKRERIYSLILLLLGRILSEKEGKGALKFREGNQDS